MGKLLKFIVIILMTGQLIAQDAESDSKLKPSLKPGKVIVEFLASGALAIGIGYGGGLIGAWLGGSGWDGLGGAIIGVGIGYPLGATTGAWMVGNTQNEQSSFWSVLTGSMIGTGLGIFALTRFETGIANYLYLGLTPLGATIAHNLGRRYKVEPGHALLNFKKNQLFWSMPSPVFSWNLHQKQKIETQLHLVSFSF